MPQSGTMLEMVQYLLHNTDLSDAELIAEAQRLVNERRYILTGNFKGRTFEVNKGN